MMCGAAPLDGDVGDAAGARIGCDVFQGYGLTETSPVVCKVPGGVENRPGSIGPLVPNTEARIVDVATGEDAAAGRARRALGARPAGDAGLPRTTPGRRRATLDDDGCLHTGDIAHGRRGRLVHDRRSPQGADQVQGLPGAAGRARGDAARPPGGRGRLRDPAARRGGRRDPEGVRRACARTRRRGAHGVGRRARRAAQAGAGARGDRRDPEVALRQDPAARAASIASGRHRRAERGDGSRAVDRRGRGAPPTAAAAGTRRARLPRRRTCRRSRRRAHGCARCGRSAVRASS